MKSSLPLRILSFTTTLLHAAAQNFQSISIPPIVSNESSTAQYISNSFFDGPKVANVNSSSYDWWYFDVVSLDHSYSMVVVFYTAASTSFIGAGSATEILEVQISVQTPEDNVFFYNATYASGATVRMDENDIEGDWKGTGTGFVGLNLAQYTIKFDAIDQLGLSGFVTMESMSPPHYPCSTAEEGASMELFPHVGWANAIPDSQAIVDLNINGASVSFVGSGYHDKNWGDMSFEDAVLSWSWGHGRLGPYSLVWFDGIAANGTEYASGYITKNGQVLGTSQCGTNNVQVRPINATFPPQVGSNPLGFNILIDLGDDYGVFEANASAENFLLEEVTGLYSRWSGSISGGLQKADESYTGTSLFEQFTF